MLPLCEGMSVTKQTPASSWKRSRRSTTVERRRNGIASDVVPVRGWLGGAGANPLRDAEVLAAPGQRLGVRLGREGAQSRVDFGGRVYLVAKYWRPDQ
jgi:hypothetical protein